MATSSRAPEPRRFTREEYYRMHDAGLFRDERVELLDGEIMPIRLDPYSEPEPDLAVCLHDPDDYESGHPTPRR